MLDWMRELLDLPTRFASTSDTGGGVIQSSASEATLVAILSARWRATRGAVNADGDTTRLVAYATAQAHSSVEKGLRIAGIGTERTRIVPHDASFAMDAKALAAMIDADRAAGLVPFFVCANHGTTSSMAFDPDARHRSRVPLDAMLWLHVDAAMSGDRRPRSRAPLGQRGRRARRQLLHQPAQVDGRQLRLRSLLDRRPPVASRRPQHPARVPALGRRRNRGGNRLPRLAGAPRSSVSRSQAVVRHPPRRSSPRSR